MGNSNFFRFVKGLFRWSLFGILPFRRLASVIIIVPVIILLFNLVSACSYFKVVSSAYPATEEVTTLPALNKTIIIHSNMGVFEIKDISVKGDSLRGTYVADYKFPSDKNTFPDVNSSNRYKKRNGDSRILNEVHFYIQNLNTYLYPGYSQRAISLKDVYRFDIYSPDKSATTMSWVFAIAGAVVAAPFVFFGLLMLIFLLSGGSCPYIYVNTADGYAFAGEIYSGAIYAPLERNDYLTLPRLIAEDGAYKLKISNELKEIQYTNLTELVVIDHPAKSKVLVDKYGHYQTSVEMRSPMAAANFTGTDLLNVIRDKDSVCYYGVSPDQELPLTDGIIMTFDNSGDACSAKLFLRARNSLWLDNVYKNTHELMGSYNDNWNRKQRNADPEKLNNWSLSQKLPLSVYVEKNGEWVFCDYFNMAGPAAFKEDVLTIDLKGIDKGPLKVKLESGSYFWEIDFAGIDYSINIPVALTTVKIDKAITNEEDLITDLLKYDDLKYYVQPHDYNIAALSFPVPPVTDSERTIILHSKGYYNILNDAGGFPQIKKLKTIREPGQFLEYSRELMKAQMDNIYKK